MKLRQWQSLCFDDARTKYKRGQKSYCCLATPGAGKTMLAANIAKWLLNEQLADFVVYISPSVSVKSTSQQVFSSILDSSFDGMFGSKGRSLTYQSLETLDETFWQLFTRFNIFVILDEVHHLAGHFEEHANSWGKTVLNRVCVAARYVLTLSGTPWRTDNIPITSVTYNHGTLQPVKDYCYGLSDAVRDGVCRIPRIISVDNDRISFTSESGEKKRFSSFSALLREKVVSYQQLVSHPEFLRAMLKVADRQLAKVQKKNKVAAGLIVASTVEHAQQILVILHSVLKRRATLVVHQNSDSADIISGFEEQDCDWLISVGMVSEGTDIPRLQVCCHLSRIRTELHFRQVIGRILRIKQGQVDNHGYLFIPSQEMLTEFASRLIQDIPEGMGTIEEYISSIPMTVQDPLETSHIETESELVATNSASDDGTLTLAASEPNDTITVGPDISLFDQFIQQIQISGSYITKEQALML